jgi:hypothetical protein
LHGAKGGEGPFVSTPHQLSTRDRDQSHGAKGGEGPFVSTPHQLSTRDRDQSHGAKGGEGPFVSTPHQLSTRDRDQSHVAKGGEGPFVSTPHQLSTRDRDQSHGAKGGEGPFVSTPAHITVTAVQRRITMDNRKSPTPLIHRQTGKPLFIVNASTPLGPVKTSHRVSKKANSTSKTIERFPVPQKPTAW